MNIVTLTLSPAFDLYAAGHQIQLHCENLIRSTARTAGGKGVNISRALHAMGISSTAIVVLGQENGQEFLQALEGEVSSILPLWTNARIRENFTLCHDGGETRLSYPAAPLTADVFPLLTKYLNEHLQDGDVLTVTGRLPDGLTPDEMRPILLDLKRKGALLVIDSKSFSLKDLQKIGPWLIKPNKEELENYSNATAETIDQVLHIARDFISAGIEQAMISLGSDGAVLADGKGAWYCPAPAIAPISTVGAGDSSIAGFLYAHAQGLSNQEKLRHAVAFGSAACLTEGSKPPTKENIMALLSR